MLFLIKHLLKHSLLFAGLVLCLEVVFALADTYSTDPHQFLSLFFSHLSQAINGCLHKVLLMNIMSFRLVQWLTWAFS